jgi:hypothetical protein
MSEEHEGVCVINHTYADISSPTFALSVVLTFTLHFCRDERA